MKNLTPLAGDPYEYFELIRDSKQNPKRAQIEFISDIVEVRYNLYKDYIRPNTLEKLATHHFTDEEKDALLHCYSSTGVLDALTQRIRFEQPSPFASICQYCEINSPDTNDHYLPKSIFPEYSVNIYNLIPCCYHCNNLKLDKWIDKNSSSRSFINFYFDRLPDQQYLFIDLKFRPDENGFQAKYYLSDQNGVDPHLYKIIQIHFRELELLFRFKVNIIAILVAVRKSCKDLLAAGKEEDDIRAYLNSFANGEKSSFGQNHHHALCYEALAKHESLMEFVMHSEE